MRKLMWFLIICLCLGCQTSGAYLFRPVQTYAEDSLSLPSAAERVKFEVSYAGHEFGGNPAVVKTVYFAITMQNISDQTVVVQPKTYALADDEGQLFSVAAESITPQADSFILAPYDSLTLTFGFDMPMTYRLEDVGSWRLRWNYQANAHTYRRTTKFLRQAVLYQYREIYWTDPSYHSPFDHDPFCRPFVYDRHCH